MSSGADPRFRIRMDDGSEVPIASLEALARRIDRGEVLPDTELFDAGTNTWSPARELAVVRFILEEREHEGRESLDAWDEAFDETGAEPPGEEAGVGDALDTGLTLDAGAFDRLEEDDAAEEAPSEFEGFTLSDDYGSRDPEEEAEEEPAREAPSAPKGTPSPLGSHDPLPLLDFPDDEDEDEAEKEEEPEPSPPPAEEPSDELPPLVFPGDQRESRQEQDGPDPQGGTSLEEWTAEPPPGPAPPTVPGEPILPPPVRPVDRRKEGEPPPTPRPAKKRPKRKKPRRKAAPGARRGQRRIVLLLAVVGALGAGVFFFGDRILSVVDELTSPREAGVEEATGAALVGEDLSGIAPVPGIPPALEAPVQRGLRAVSVRFDVVVDSLRAVHGLADAPPREWLSGYYLAHASEFPRVRSFWEAYGALVAELRQRDPELFLTTAVRAGTEPDPERTRSVEAYLQERYRAVRPLRRERYHQLTQVALRAEELHDFLVSREAEIRFTPALGPEVPVDDPVMEARAERPEVQDEMLRRLDALFQALDRSRGEGAPGMGGLTQDLFRRFGEG